MINETKNIVLAKDEGQPFRKIASRTGLPIESIRLKQTGMGFFRVFFYEEKTEFIINFSQRRENDNK